MRNIVDLHHGDVVIAPYERTGIRLEVRLPVRQDGQGQVHENA